MEGSLLEWIGYTLPHTSILSMEIVDCPSMNIILDCCYSFLQTLIIIGSCDSLRTFPLSFFKKLDYMVFRGCRNLELITQDYKLDYSLVYMSITECPNFVSFPEGGFSSPSLKNFDICRLQNLKSLPECMHTLFPSLTSLTIDDCPQLEVFSNGGLPPSLKSMVLYGCSNLLLSSLKWALGINTSLKRLHIGNVDVESFPDQGLLPRSLTSLRIDDCVNLKKLDHKGLCHLSSLEDLILSGCPSLQCLLVEGLPKTISALQVTDCLLLKQRCMKPNGEDWGKISHIQCVDLKDDFSFEPHFLKYL